jgi:hypothetical protein
MIAISERAITKMKKKKAGKDMTLFQHQMTLSHWPTTMIGAGGER